MPEYFIIDKDGSKFRNKPLKYQSDFMQLILDISGNPWTNGPLLQWRWKSPNGHNTFATAQFVDQYTVIIRGNKHTPTIFTRKRYNSDNLPTVVSRIKNKIIESYRKFDTVKNKVNLNNKLKWKRIPHPENIRFINSISASSNTPPGPSTALPGPSRGPMMLSANVRKLIGLHTPGSPERNKINRDVEKRKKELDWLWYIFPTSQPGRVANVKITIGKNNHMEAYKAFNLNPYRTWWLNKLEKIASKNGGYREYVKNNDLGRINSFKSEWMAHINAWKNVPLTMHTSSSGSTLEDILRKFNSTSRKRPRFQGPPQPLPPQPPPPQPSLPTVPHGSIRHECRGMCAVGWEMNQRGLSVGIGIAGNSGRFGGACGKYLNPGETEEKRRESLDANGRFAINTYTMIKTHPYHTTAEESVVSNIHETCKRLRRPDLALLNLDGRLKIRWGLIHPIMDAGRRGSKRTFQGIDYTKPSGRSAFKKYNYAAGIRTAACFQELGGAWDLSKSYECVAIFTAGPNNGNLGETKYSAQTRTIDPDAAIYSNFRKGIVDALVATLSEMKRLSVQAALIPGLSTGLYAGAHKSTIRSEFMSLLHEAVQHLGDMGTIREVIYCNS